MAGLNNEIIILIDISSFRNNQEWLDDLIDHVKEAVSLQISRGAVTNRKLIRLGLEPYLARVKWTYSFFDSTCENQDEASIVQPAQTLTYECWDIFEAKLNQAVKSACRGNTVATPVAIRVQNIVKVLGELKLSCPNSSATFGSMSGREPEQHHPNCRCSVGMPLDNCSQKERLIFVFTTVPKIFSYLVHLATGISECRNSISFNAQCKPCDIKICFVDVKYDSITLQKYTCLDTLPCFWDEFYGSKSESGATCHVSLKISCLKKIMMIHKLMELRFPWMYESALRLPFGFGMGMKRLRQWEWRIPQEMPKSQQGDQESRCLPLRKCLSEELY